MTPVFELARDEAEVRTRCQECRVEIVLAVEEEEPSRLALTYAAAAMLCERCSAAYEAAVKAEETRRDLDKRARASKLPEPLRALTFDQMIATGPRARAIQAAREWADAGHGLVLYGPTGVGKTRLAGTAAWQRVLDGKPVTWVSVAVLMAQLGAAFSDPDRRAAIEVLTGTGPLVLDDFDKVNPTEWARTQLFAAIDRRISADAPLLVTTNLKPAALREKFGEAIASRLAGCKTIELTGPDYRLRLDETI